MHAIPSRLMQMADDSILVNLPELFHDATILATASVLPESPEDCPDLSIHTDQST